MASRGSSLIPIQCRTHGTALSKGQPSFRNCSTNIFSKGGKFAYYMGQERAKYAQRSARSCRKLPGSSRATNNSMAKSYAPYICMKNGYNKSFRHTQPFLNTSRARKVHLPLGKKYIHYRKITDQQVKIITSRHCHNSQLSCRSLDQLHCYTKVHLLPRSLSGPPHCINACHEPR